MHFRLLIKILFVFSPLLSVTTHARSQDDTDHAHHIPYSYLNNCADSSCWPFKIRRKKKADSLQLLIHHRSTEGRATLYTKEGHRKWLEWLKSEAGETDTGAKKPEPLFDEKSVYKTGQFTKSSEPVRLNLTGLSDGKYVLHLYSCGVGGNYHLSIGTIAD